MANTIPADNKVRLRHNTFHLPVRSAHSGGTNARARPLYFDKIAADAQIPKNAESRQSPVSRYRPYLRIARKLKSATQLSAITRLVLCWTSGTLINSSPAE